MSEPSKLSIQDLEIRYRNALLLSEMSVRCRPQVYRELKQVIAEINSRVLDVSEYYPIALRLAGLLRTLARKEDVTIFDYFLQTLNPSHAGNVQYFRYSCLDLSEQLTRFDQWRLDRHRLRRIK